MRKKILISLIALILTTFNFVHAEDTTIKQKVDRLNTDINNLYEHTLTTYNGAVIFTNDNIYYIDKAKHEVAMTMEKLRNNNNYIYIEYPVVSEIEHFGILDDYSREYCSAIFFEEQLENPNLNYHKNMIKENYVYTEDFNIFLRGINILNIDLNGLEIIFNPYQIYDDGSLGYFMNYSNDLNIIRSRIYMNKTFNNIDYLSTFYHELGHFIYKNYVEKNEDILNRYYNLYKKEFDKKKNVFGPEVKWKDRLTENFAEDFKYYIAKKIIEKDYILGKYIEKHKDNFYKKWTDYPYSEHLDIYFDDLLNIIQEKTNSYRYRADIGIKLDDYNQEFKLYNLSYLNNHVNKIVTNGENIEINLYYIDKSYLKPYQFSVYELDDSNEVKIYSKKLKENTVISVGEKDLRVDLEFRDKHNETIVETITYFIIKEG